MTPEQIVDGLRAYVAANPSPFRDRHVHVEFEDTAPEPSLAEQCRECREFGTCGTAECDTCSGPVTRHASHWWHCHGTPVPWHRAFPRDQYATPAVKEKPCRD